MDLITIFKIAVAASVGVAFITNLTLYIALRSRDVQVDFMRSIRPGYLENLYRQTQELKSPFLDLVALLCTLSKVSVIIVGIGLLLVGSLKK